MQWTILVDKTPVTVDNELSFNNTGYWHNDKENALVYKHTGTQKIF